MAQTENIATYHYSVYNYGTEALDYKSALVEVIGATDKSYKIRLLEFTNNRIPKDEMWVRKKQIVFKNKPTPKVGFIYPEEMERVKRWWDED